MNETLSKNSVGLIFRQKEPDNLEPAFDQIDSFLTPTHLFYIRSHFPVPKLESCLPGQRRHALGSIRVHPVLSVVKKSDSSGPAVTDPLPSACL